MFSLSHAFVTRPMPKSLSPLLIADPLNRRLNHTVTVSVLSFVGVVLMEVFLPTNYIYYRFFCEEPQAFFFFSSQASLRVGASGPPNAPLAIKSLVD